MTDSINPQKNFVRTWLPWAIAAAALVLYAITLNRWVTPASLPFVSRIGNWDWQPSLFPPVYFIVTAPFRLLPSAMLPVALNLFAALCGTLTLALLARSVALLPDDRTQSQREGIRNARQANMLAWIPPVLAALACGLQLTFWSHTQAANVEIFDLLMFAYIVRCLLEFRLDQRQSWLTKVAIVQGAGMANNWSFISLLPVLLIALVWLKGRTFLNKKFLLRMAAWGLLGLSFYLVMPIVLSMTPGAPGGFWEALKGQFSSQKYILTNMPYKALFPLALYSVFPMFIIGFRWASSFGDNSPLGAGLATLSFHIVHAAFLAVCLWVMFDPPFAPRRFGQSMGIELPFLKTYFLSALAIGYFAKYFLVVFRRVGDRRRAPGMEKVLHRAAIAVLLLLIVLAPLGLVYKNLPQIRQNNAPFVRDYAMLTLESLPDRQTIVLSDDVMRLFLLKAAINSSGLEKKHILLNTALLKYPGYIDYAQKKHALNWKNLLPKNPDASMLGDLALIGFLGALIEQSHVYYLHPSFGYYFEQFYQVPRGGAFELARYPANTISPPPLSQDVINANKAFWAKAEKQALAALADAVKDSQSPIRETGFMKAMKLVREPNRTAEFIGTLYSRELNSWGITLQKHGKFADAEPIFAMSQALNPANIAARVNLASNKKLQAGESPVVPMGKSLEEEFGKYRSWQQVMNECGFFDEPMRCLEQGRIFAKGSLPRQSLQQFERAHELTPTNSSIAFMLIQAYAQNGFSERVIESVASVQQQIQSGAIDSDTAAQLDYLAAVAHFDLGNPDKGTAALRRAMSAFPDNEGLLVAATRLYLGAKDYTNALEVIEKHLKLAPDNPSALVNKGFVAIQLKDYNTAVGALDHALAIDSANNEALFNRAIAHFQNKNYEAARRDYERLKAEFPQSRQVYYGLGEIAYATKDLAAAIENYQLYLSNSPAATPERELIIKRLNELKAAR